MCFFGQLNLESGGYIIFYGAFCDCFSLVTPPKQCKKYSLVYHIMAVSFVLMLV